MLHERILFWPKRVPEYTLFLIISGLMAVAVHSFLPDVLTVTLIYFPFLLAVEGISRSPAFIGFINARRDLTMVVLMVALSLFALVLQFRKDLSGTQNTIKSLVTFCLIGVGIGLTFRHSWQRMAFLALTGKRRLGQILLTNAIWSLAIVFYPTGPHKSAATAYILCIALGLLLHKASRLRLTQAAAAFRRIEHIADAWPPRERALPVEQTALALLARGRQIPSMRFKKLRRFLENSRQEDNFPNRLRLISASVFRLEGEWQRAIDEASEITGTLEEIADVNLSLLRIMSLDELGMTVKADNELARVLESRAGKECPLANALLAYRKAEHLLFAMDETIPPIGPLQQAMAAMDLRAKILRARLSAPKHDERSIDRFLGRFLEIGVPITASFWMDILGYCHLAAGHAEEASVLLQRCIEIDPEFSPAFLHLGDYFLFRNRLAHGGSGASSADLWHAEACYVAAYYIERNAASRIKREARKRIQLVQQLAEGRRAERKWVVAGAEGAEAVVEDEAIGASQPAVASSAADRAGDVNLTTPPDE